MSNPVDRMRERILQQMQVAVALGVLMPLGRRDRLRGFLVRQFFVAPGDPHAIDEPLRQDRAQPRREAAAAVKIAKQGLTIGSAIGDAEQVAVERIHELPRPAGRVHGVGGAIERRPELAHEVFPRVFVARRAPAGEREILEMQGRQVPLDFVLVGSAARRGPCPRWRTGRR